MSKEKREAAERVLSRLSACCKTKGNCGDITDVCNEVIVNNLPDDDVLVDIEWARTLKGWDEDRSRRFSLGIHGLIIDCHMGGYPRLWCGGSVVVVHATRGDVRRLHKALHLELVERVEERQTV